MGTRKASSSPLISDTAPEFELANIFSTKSEAMITATNKNALYLTMASSKLKLCQSWREKRNMQIISVLRDWIRYERDLLLEDDEFIRVFTKALKEYPELDEPPNNLGKYLKRESTKFVAAGGSKTSTKKKSSGSTKFGSIRRKKGKGREKMRMGSLQKLVEGESQSEVEKLNPLFRGDSGASLQGKDAEGSSTLVHLESCNPGGSVKDENCITPNNDPVVAQFYRKFVKKLMDQPEMIAQQITLADSKLFKAIPRNEFLRGNFAKIERAPCFSKMATAFNRTSNWVASQIVLTPNSEVRGRMLMRFIELGRELRELNNFHALFALSMALNHSSISRLKESWDKVPKKHLEKLQEFSDICQLTGNFKNYSIALHTSTPPMIPFLGQIAKTLESTEEGNPTWTTPMLKGDQTARQKDKEQITETLINYDKFRLLYKTVSDIMTKQKQMQMYSIIEDLEWIEYFQNIPHLSEEELFRQSYVCEPRKRASTMV